MPWRCICAGHEVGGDSVQHFVVCGAERPSSANARCPSEPDERKEEDICDAKRDGNRKDSAARPTFHHNPWHELAETGRAHVRTPVTWPPRMPPSPRRKKTDVRRVFEHGAAQAG